MDGAVRGVPCAHQLVGGDPAPLDGAEDPVEVGAGGGVERLLRRAPSACPVVIERAARVLQDVARPFLVPGGLELLEHGQDVSSQARDLLNHLLGRGLLGVEQARQLARVDAGGGSRRVRVLDGWGDHRSASRQCPEPNNWVRTDAVAAGNTDGGPGLDFDFPADLTEHAQAYRDAAVTNLFYWNNVIHDVMSDYGFDEASGNFQTTNYSGQGGGGDFVRAEAADGAGTNNANFSTPAADGGTPRMQMFLWPGAQFGPPNQLVVDGVGSFGGNFARFSAAPTNAGQAGVIVNAGNGCDASQYPASLPSGDWIALVATGTCTNVVKGQVAQAQGASAIVVTGTTAILSGAISEPEVTIPVMSLSTADGNAVRAALPASGTVRKHPDHPGIRDGDLENGIIIHEYSHGTSLRLTGGPGVNCLGGTEQMGEGWSDYYAITTLTDPELDDPAAARGMGPYALFQDDRHGAIRPRPYSQTWDIQPFSYDSIKTGGWLANAAGQATSLAAPHGVGHGRASVLWDMNWDLIDKHGFNPNVYEAWSTGGNNLALQLVTDGLKIQGCNPTFVVGRDAILAADQALTGGENQCTIWASFARRGVGFSAVGGGTSRDDGTEAFDTHPDCVNGFAAPVADQPDLNTVAAGRTVPMKFNRPDLTGMDVLTPNSPFSRRVDCQTLAVPSDDPPRRTPKAAPITASTPGEAGLTRSATGRYTYPWQTEEDWIDTCRELLGNAGLHVDLGEAYADRCDERGGRIDRRDGIGARTFYQLRGQCSGSTADVQHPLTSLHIGQLRELRRQRL